MPATARSDAGSSIAGLELSRLLVQHRQADGCLAKALEIEALALTPGSLVGISGPSGSGKTTLLHLIAGLLRLARGALFWCGDDLASFSETRRDAWRRTTIGFVFQDFHLVPELDVIGNILLPTSFARRTSATPGQPQAADLARRFGLTDPSRRAGLLSRGEQQRVAVARALLLGPALILADEPTASLDADNAAAVSEALVTESRRLGAMLIVVSHDEALLARMDRRIRLDKGRILSDEAQP